MEKKITMNDLDTRVSDFYDGKALNEETFREFITNSESHFSIEPNMDNITNDKELQDYIDFLDELWMR